MNLGMITVNQSMETAKVCYMDTDSFFIHIETEDFYKDIANDVEKWSKNVLGLFKDELGGKIMKVFVELRAKTQAYLMDDNSEKKKAKGTKKCVRKRELIVENYTDCLSNNKIILKSEQRFKSDHHVLCTEEVNKMVLSANDDKRLQTSDKITTYPHATNASKVCESEMMIVRDVFGENYADCLFYD